MEQTTSKDGTVIGFKKSGSGPALLLVHGTTADHSRWSGILPKLEQHFTVYVMDRRGRGASGDSPDYSIIHEAEDVAAVIETIGESVYLLGHSYGAICSLEASLLTDKIQRLILYEPPVPTGLSLYPPDFPDRMQTLIEQDQLESALELFFREIVKMPDHEFDKYRQLPMWETRIQLAPTIPRELTIDRHYEFEPDKFTAMQVPTLLMLGGDSPQVFQQAIEIIDTALPDSRVTVLPGEQHIVMDTNPDLFIQEVLDYLLE